jgi:hypothetical protein
LTDQAKLERAYRRLLTLYPRAFRREHGEEILGVLMAGSRGGRQRPGIAASADLIVSGLGMRLRSRGPRPPQTVRAAVRLMYAGAAATVVVLIVSLVSLALIGSGGSALRLAGRSQPLLVALVGGTLGGVIVIALWLWLARSSSRGRSWARVVSTLLCALATVELISIFSGAQTVLGLILWGPTWLVGAAAVWLLWQPDSCVFFKARDLRRSDRGA